MVSLRMNGHEVARTISLLRVLSGTHLIALTGYGTSNRPRLLDLTIILWSSLSPMRRRRWSCVSHLLPHSVKVFLRDLRHIGQWLIAARYVRIRTDPALPPSPHSAL